MAGHGFPEDLARDASDLTVGIVATRWHSTLVDQMVDRSLTAARSVGITEIQVVRVAGSVELPVVAQSLARRHDAVVALGVVIRGATAHFDYVCRSVTDGLTQVALMESTPIGQGVLMVEDISQARDRVGFPISPEDKGWSATLAAVESALILRDLHKG